jgi:hypothetical protein
MNPRINWLKGISALLFLLIALGSLFTQAATLRIDQENGKWILGVDSNGARHHIPTEHLQKFVQLSQMKAYKPLMEAMMKVSGAKDAVGVHDSLATALARGTEDKKAIELIKTNFELFKADPEKFLTQNNFSKVDFDEQQRTKEECLKPLQGKISEDNMKRVSSFFDGLAALAADTNCGVLYIKTKENTASTERVRYAPSSECVMQIASNTTGMGTGEVRITLRNPNPPPTATSGIDDLYHRTITYNSFRQQPLSTGEWMVQLYTELGKKGLCVNAKREQPILTRPEPVQEAAVSK